VKHVIAAIAVAALSSAAGAQSVTVQMSEFKLKMSRDTVKAGSVRFTLTNVGEMSHALHIKGPGVDKETQIIAKGQASTMTVTLKPGTYDVYCPMSEGSHKMAGMDMKLVVTEATPTKAAKKP
jgi:plastocyanin